MFVVALLSAFLYGCGTAEKDTAEMDGGETAPLVEMENGVHELQVDGSTRSYILYQPENVVENPPLVVVMHGYSSNAGMIQAYSGMNDQADEHGFVVAYPEGTIDDDGNPFFHVGYAFHSQETVDDVAFVKAVVSKLQSNLGVHSENVFAAGLSNGGDMSYMLACQASDVFKAIGSVAGLMFDSFAADCVPENPISIFEIHGTVDSVSCYEGDADNSGGWGPYWGVEEGFDFWVAANALDQMGREDIPDIDPDDGSNIIFERRWSNSSNTEVWLYRVVGGGHDWPGVWGNMDIQSSVEIWSFFSQVME